MVLEGPQILSQKSGTRFPLQRTWPVMPSGTPGKTSFVATLLTNQANSESCCLTEAPSDVNRVHSRDTNASRHRDRTPGNRCHAVTVETCCIIDVAAQTVPAETTEETRSSFCGKVPTLSGTDGRPENPSDPGPGAPAGTGSAGSLIDAPPPRIRPNAARRICRRGKRRGGRV